jgi:hypothetical protein
MLATRRSRWIAAALTTLFFLALVGVMEAIAFRNMLQMVSTVQNLKDIGIAHAEFVNRNKRLPKSFEELDLRATSLFDPATEQPFQWVPPEEALVRNGATLVAKQPTSVCVLFWPIGPRNQCGAFSDGSVMTIYGQ